MFLRNLLPPSQYTFTRPHSVTFQKMATFRVTTVRTTNLIFMNKKVHYNARKRMAKDPSLSQTNTLHILILHFKTFYLNTILPSKPMFFKWSLLSSVQIKLCLYFSSTARMPAALLLWSFSVWINTIIFGGQNTRHHTIFIILPHIMNYNATVVKTTTDILVFSVPAVINTWP